MLATHTTAEIRCHAFLERGPGQLAVPEQAWAELVSGLMVHVVAGDHATLLDPPNVGQAASLLRAALRKH